MKINFTRGEGLLDQMLARIRANKAKEILKNIKNRQRILDIGCGSYPYFLTVSDFKEKFGIDPIVTRSELPGINLRKMNVEKEKLPFKSNFFNVVTMLAVFEHVRHDKLKNVLSESFRVVGENGLFVITTPSPWSDKLLHGLARIGLISAEEIHEHKHNLTSRVIKDLLVDCGFKREKINNGYFELGFNMWFVAKK